VALQPAGDFEFQQHRAHDRRRSLRQPHQIVERNRRRAKQSDYARALVLAGLDIERARNVGRRLLRRHVEAAPQDRLQYGDHVGRFGNQRRTLLEQPVGSLGARIERGAGLRLLAVRRCTPVSAFIARKPITIAYYDKSLYATVRLRLPPFEAMNRGRNRGQELRRTMPRRAKGLSAAKVSKAGPGRYGDGAGLYLLVRSPEAKFWTFRYVRAGKMREMGLGPANGRTGVSLVDARKKARTLYDMHREGRDPLDERAAGRALQAAETAKAVKFSEAAERYIAAHRAGWRNAKHVQQWENTIATYAAPVLGSLPVQAVDVALVMKVLEPIWTEKPSTAGRLRGRIESILDWAKARGYRDGENPARWKGHLNNLLPARSKIARVEHHAALAYDELPDFMAALRAREGIAARALEYAILTAARSGEVIGARWDEINLREKVWVVPGKRMKSGREHRAPLSARAGEILKQMNAHDHDAEDYVFSGSAGGGLLPHVALRRLLHRMGRDDLTVHGFRSSFRDWCAERTNFPSEAAEMALAHAVGDRVEAAYRRGDLLEKRAQMMEAWAAFCAQPPSKGERVVPIRRREGAS
jgi:integrase